MKYDKYFYIYPPRPEKTTHFSELKGYDNNLFVAQPKYNGTCCIVFIPPKGGKAIVMNRHKLPIKNTFGINFESLNTTEGWMVVVGELLNKSKRDEKNEVFNGKYIMFDILVLNSEYLIGSTIEQRLAKMEVLFPSTRMSVSKKGVEGWEYLLTTRVENVYKAPSYENDFLNLYEKLVVTDMYEGVVLKRRDAKLSLGLNEKNNADWQIKCRKPTKNYNF